jgi:anti-sigma regulatory factor (Ser/Thr protein kinase)
MGTEKRKSQRKQEWRTLAEFAFPSEPGNERRVMEQVVDAIRVLDLPDTRVERLKTAVSEAAMNAIEHGNHYKPELPVEVRVLVSDRSLEVDITDQGGNAIQPEPEAPDLAAKLEGQQSHRGWGLFLIKKMVDRMHVSTDETHHTVELILDLK